MLSFEHQSDGCSTEGSADYKHINGIRKAVEWWAERRFHKKRLDLSYSQSYSAARNFMRKSWLVIIQVAISVLLLWFFFRDADLRVQAGRVLALGKVGWLLGGILTAVVSEVLCAVRWWVVLRTLCAPIKIGQVVVFFWAGLFYSVGLPGGAGGDAFRVMYALRIHPNRKARVALSVLADRLCGWGALFLWFLIACWRRGPVEGDETSALVFRSATLVLGGTLFLLFFWWVGTLPCVDSLRMPERVRRVRKKMAPFTQGFAVLAARPKGVGVAVGLSVLSLAAHFSTYFCSARAFSLPLSWGDLSKVMPVVDVLVMLPVTLFGVGLRETLFERLLASFHGVGAASALLVSMGGFVLQVVVALSGILCVPFSGGASPQEGQPSGGASVNALD